MNRRFELADIGSSALWDGDQPGISDWAERAGVGRTGPGTPSDGVLYEALLRRRRSVGFCAGTKEILDVMSTIS